MRIGLLRAIPAAALAAIAVWEIARTERAGAGVADDDAWKRAADVVRLQWKPGDLIVFAPRWIDPVGRLWLGDLMPVDVVGRADSPRFGSVWELSIRGAHAPEASGPGATIDRDVEVDGITVRHIERRAAVVVTDFVDTIGRAEIAGDRDRGPAATLAEVDFGPHRCVEVVPTADRSVTITFRGAALGSRLAGHVGLADVFTRRDVREPGRLVVRVGDREVARVTVGDDDGWVPFAASTAGTDRADVTFEATAVGPGARDRHICFAAEALQ